MTTDRFDQANDFAREGCYVEAFELLQDCLRRNECSEVEALELQARMYAQQGYFLEAEASWNRALEKGASKVEIDAALSQLRAKVRTNWQPLRIIGATAIIFLFAILVWHSLVLVPRTHERLVQIEALTHFLRSDLSRFDSTTRINQENNYSALNEVKVAVGSLRSLQSSQSASIDRIINRADREKKTLDSVRVILDGLSDDVTILLHQSIEVREKAPK